MTEWLPENVLFDEVYEEFEAPSEFDDTKGLVERVYSERASYNDRLFEGVPVYDKEESERLRREIIALRRPKGTGVKSRPEYDSTEADFLVRSLTLADSLVLSSFGLPRDRDGRMVKDFDILGGRFKLSNLRYVDASFEERAALAVEALEESIAMIANVGNRASQYAFSTVAATKVHEQLKYYHRHHAPGVTYIPVVVAESVVELEYSLGIALQELTSDPVQADLAAASAIAKKRKDDRRKVLKSAKDDKFDYEQQSTDQSEDINTDDYIVDGRLLETIWNAQFRQPLSLEHISEIQEANGELDWRETLADPESLAYEDEVILGMASYSLLLALAIRAEMKAIHADAVKMRFSNPKVVNGREVDESTYTNIGDHFGIVGQSARNRVQHGINSLRIAALGLDAVGESTSTWGATKSRLKVDDDYLFSDPSHIESLTPRLGLSKQTRATATGKRFSVSNRLTYKPDPSEEN